MIPIFFVAEKVVEAVFKVQRGTEGAEVDMMPHVKGEDAQ